MKAGSAGKYGANYHLIMDNCIDAQNRILERVGVKLVHDHITQVELQTNLTNGAYLAKLNDDEEQSY
jgi:hypothetical protein